MKRFILTSVLLTSALALLVTLFSARSVSATTYYVATSGSDPTNGISESTPWAHLPGMPDRNRHCWKPHCRGRRHFYPGGDVTSGITLRGPAIFLWY